MILELDYGAGVLEAWVGRIRSYYRLSAYMVPEVDRITYEISRIGGNAVRTDRQNASLASQLAKETMVQIPEQGRVSTVVWTV